MAAKGDDREVALYRGWGPWLKGPKPLDVKAMEGWGGQDDSTSSVVPVAGAASTDPCGDNAPAAAAACHSLAW